MNKGKAATALAIAVALLAMGALAVLPLSERNPYEVHEVPTAEEDATMEAQETGGGIDWDALPASVVAWVRVPGTTVDYPIVQGRPESPDFYLTHDAGGERSAWGAPYIDAGCAQGAESPLVIVYGHHMSDGTMFAPLAQYSSRDFAEGRSSSRSSRPTWSTRARRASGPTSPTRRSSPPTSGTNCPGARSSWKSLRTSRRPGPS